MKHRDSILRELNKIEGLTNQLNFMINQQQPIEEYKAALERLRESVEQARAYVESEPVDGYELNVAAR
jgi:nitrogen fixation/metabolism regulation signal transduction histidine kinase